MFNQRDSRFTKDFYMVICHRQWNERTILKQFPFFQFSSNKIESRTEIYNDKFKKGPCIKNGRRDISLDKCVRLYDFGNLSVQMIFFCYN